MIFKKLFKSTPKWQNDDAEIRLVALQELSLDDAKQKAIIEQMAREDSTDKVRIAALELLNDFNFWVIASNKEKNERVKKHAQEQVRLGLIGQASYSIDETIKRDYIAKCHKGPLLEELAVIEKDEKSRFNLLSRINKSNLFVQTLQDNQASDWLKKQIIDKFDDLASLEKLAKKANGDVKTLISSKIDNLKLAIEKPKQLQKDVGLMLAKLNALKDKTDVLDIEQRQAQLNEQWQQFKDSFELLTEEQVAQYNAKFDKISTSLNNLVAPLKQKWQEQQQAEQDRADKAANKQAISERLAAVEATLTQAISEHNTEQEQDYAEPLKQIRQDMQQMNLSESDKNHFIAQMEKVHQKIDQIPLITECVNHAMTLIKQLSEMPLPQDSEELAQVHGEYKNWQKQWQANKGKMGLALPATLTTSYEQLTNSWNEAIEPLLKEQDQQFSQARKAISDLRYLLNGGKYRRAFGLFKKASFLMEQLNQWQQSKLSREYETIKAKVEDLADWQDYIAAPRKQQILEEMQELANNPVDSPQEQAQKVKFTRQMWNSLGRANDDKDQDINAEFDKACEQAFDVCRKFYAEQEATRMRNLAAKEQVCEQLEQTKALLSEESVPWQKIESALAAARKAFKEAGEVDREQVKQINQRFYDLLNPIQKQLRDYHGENASLKEKLLNSAQALLEQEDVFEATNQLKDLQKKWKTIGFAGGKVDGAIWRKFREVNDKVFAKRDEVKNQRNEENQAQLNDFSQQLEAIEQAVLNTDELAVLNKNISELNALSQSLRDMPKHVQAKVSERSNKLEQLINTRKKEMKLAADREKYVTLFAQFEQVSQHGQIDPEIESTSQWNDVLQAMPEQADGDLRYDLTIQLEIVAGVESPVRDTDRRMSLQMGLLSDKLSGGELAAQDELLKSWVATGRLAPDDEPLLDRVKALYL